MKTVAELEYELAQAKERERLAREQCASCSGKGWYCDSTYDRSGEDVSCDRCHGTGLPDKRVAEIIREAFKPYRKPVCGTAKPEPAPAIGDQEWCQPGDIRKRQFLVTFDDPDCRNAVFDDETEARRFWAKACLNWNCYLFGSLPVTPPPAQKAEGPALQDEGKP